jgi:hypothetical protein
VVSLLKILQPILAVVRIRVTEVDRTRFRCLQGKSTFVLQTVNTGSEAHTTWTTEAYPPGWKRQKQEADPSHPSSAGVRYEQSWKLAPHTPVWRAQGKLTFIPSFSFLLHIPSTALYISNGGTSEVMRKTHKLLISELFNFLLFSFNH